MSNQDEVLRTLQERLAAVERRAAGFEEGLAGIQDRLAVKDQEVNSLESSKADLKRRVVYLEKVAHDGELARAGEPTTSADAKVHELTGQLAERERRINYLEQRLNDKTEEFCEMSGKVREMARKLAARAVKLEQAVDERDEALRLIAKVAPGSTREVSTSLLERLSGLGLRSKQAPMAVYAIPPSGADRIEATFDAEEQIVEGSETWIDKI
ncbi:hypothetical protein LTR95_006501 [Oleoguttula sp. CCFEE 5521]